MLTGRGEASGVALAQEILAEYSDLTTGPRIAFFEALAPPSVTIAPASNRAIAKWRQSPSADNAAELHHASEPRRLELFRRLNLAPGGTAALVRMREQLLDAMAHRDELSVVDNDFIHLFSSWFNRGFLVLRRIDWSTRRRSWKKSSITRRSTRSGTGPICAGASICPTAAATPSFIRRWSTSR